MLKQCVFYIVLCYIIGEKNKYKHNIMLNNTKKERKSGYVLSV